MKVTGIVLCEEDDRLISKTAIEAINIVPNNIRLKTRSWQFTNCQPVLKFDTDFGNHQDVEDPWRRNERELQKYQLHTYEIQ